MFVNETKLPSLQVREEKSTVNLYSWQNNLKENSNMDYFDNCLKLKLLLQILCEYVSVFPSQHVLQTYICSNERCHTPKKGKGKRVLVLLF